MHLCTPESTYACIGEACRGCTLTSLSKDPVTNKPVSMGYQAAHVTLYLCAPGVFLSSLKAALCSLGPSRVTVRGAPRACAWVLPA